jgi:hypothetical protein
MATELCAVGSRINIVQIGMMALQLQQWVSPRMSTSWDMLDIQYIFLITICLTNSMIESDIRNVAL